MKSLITLLFIIFILYIRETFFKVRITREYNIYYFFNNIILFLSLLNNNNVDIN